MICPNCKNEKWSEEVCPQCGLDSKAALLKQGDLYQQQGRTLEAVKFYEQYLGLDPDQWDVMRKRAIGLYSVALATGTKPLFEKADQALALALDKEWDWEQGHQFRINLFYAFGDLTEMEQVYTRISQENPPRKEMAEKILKVIQLTEKFANPGPPSQDAAPEPEPAQKPLSWLHLFLFSIPLWLWIIQLFLFPSDAENLNANPKTLFIGNAVLSICAVGMILVGMILLRPKSSKTKNQKTNKKSELNFPEE